MQALSTAKFTPLPFDQAQHQWSERHRLLGGFNLPCCDIDGIYIRRGQIIEGLWLEYHHSKPVAIYDLLDDAPDRFDRRVAMSRLADRAELPAFTIGMRHTEVLDAEGDVTWRYKVFARNELALEWIDLAEEMGEARLIEFLYALRGIEPDLSLEGVSPERNAWRDERLSAMFRALELPYVPSGRDQVSPYIAFLNCIDGAEADDRADDVVAILEAKKFPARVEDSASVRALQWLSEASGAHFEALEYKHRAAVAGDAEARPVREEWDFRVGDRILVARQMAQRLAQPKEAALPLLYMQMRQL